MEILLPIWVINRGLPVYAWDFTQIPHPGGLRFHKRSHRQAGRDLSTKWSCKTREAVSLKSIHLILLSFPSFYFGKDFILLDRDDQDCYFFIQNTISHIYDGYLYLCKTHNHPEHPVPDQYPDAWGSRNSFLGQSLPPSVNRRKC